MKIDRLLDIVMLLYRRTTTVGELAKLFGGSERTIYRDLTSLDCAGFPLDSSPGRGSAPEAIVIEPKELRERLAARIASASLVYEKNPRANSEGAAGRGLFLYRGPAPGPLGH